MKSVIYIGIFLFFFGVGVYWFRFGQKPDAHTTGDVPTIVDVLTPEPIVSSGHVEDGYVVPTDARLVHVLGHSWNGKAQRSDEDGVFALRVDAELPQIDETNFFYEVWLLRKLPYDFFSTQALIRHPESGSWQLEWTSTDQSRSVFDYTDVIVTLEPHDGNPGPGVHVLEGTFE